MPSHTESLIDTLNKMIKPGACTCIRCRDNFEYHRVTQAVLKNETQPLGTHQHFTKPYPKHYGKPHQIRIDGQTYHMQMLKHADEFKTRIQAAWREHYNEPYKPHQATISQVRKMVGEPGATIWQAIEMRRPKKKES